MANWSYIGTPYSGIQKVRALIGDVDTNDQATSDHEIDAVLAVFPNETEAAAHICRNLAMKFARIGDITVGRDKFEHISKAKFFKEMSVELFTEVYGYSRPLALAGISFGGVSASGKEANRLNTDNVQPKFYRGQFEDLNENSDDDA